MKFELLSDSHSVGEANYHLQFTPAYRRDIFADELVRILTRDYLLAAGRRHGIPISAIGFGPDHVHLFTTGCKNYGAAEAARLLKGFSSYMMRKHHYSLFKHKLRGRFWSAGYFYRTVGAVNAGTVHRYVEEGQQKHWTAEKKRQRTLIEFGQN